MDTFFTSSTVRFIFDRCHSRIGMQLAISVLLAVLSACGGEKLETMVPTTNMMPAPPAAGVQNTVAVTGSRADYLLSRTSKAIEVTELKTGKLLKLPLSTELIAFSDLSLNLSMANKSKAISEQDLKQLIELYVAFFNRVPDAEGLAYWISERAAGKSMTSIADAFYSAALAYSQQTGYSAQLSEADFVRIIYKNVLGRSGVTAPPQADVDYWVAQLLSGKVSKGTLVITILNAAHTFANHPEFGWVASLLDNKFAVAAKFAIEQGITIKNVDDSLSRTMTIAASVNPNSKSGAEAQFSKLGVKEIDMASAPQMVGEPRFTQGNPSLLEVTFDRDMAPSYQTMGSYLLRASGWRSDLRTFYMELDAYIPNGSISLSKVGDDGKLGFASVDLVPISDDIVFYFPKSDEQLLEPPAVLGQLSFQAGNPTTLQLSFNSEMKSSFAVDGDFTLKAGYWLSNRRTFVLELKDYVPGGILVFSGKAQDGSSGFVSTAGVPMAADFVYRLPLSDSSNSVPSPKVVDGPRFTDGLIKTVSISFDRSMGIGYSVTGDYVPRNSYWTLDRRTFIVELKSYVPGGRMVFQGGANSSFRSSGGVPLEADVSITFPDSKPTSLGYANLQSGPIFFDGATPKLTLIFDRDMRSDFRMSGNYVVKNSYWLFDKRTFIVEFESYAPGGQIRFAAGNEGGFRSVSDEPVAEPIVFVFPQK